MRHIRIFLYSFLIAFNHNAVLVLAQEDDDQTDYPAATDTIDTTDDDYVNTETVGSTTTIMPAKPTGPTFDFSRLTLDQKFLVGTRWVIEEEQDGQKINVYHSIDILDVSIDVQARSMRVEFHLCQRWMASDLEIPEGLFTPRDTDETNIRVDPGIFSSMWDPSSFIPNARDTKIAKMSSTSSVVNLYRNKTIKYKTRMFTLLVCYFNFRWYPLDQQKCDLSIESYKYQSSMVRYLWEPPVNQPVTLSPNVALSQYKLQKPLRYTNGTASRWGRGRKYSYIIVTFTFERQLENPLIQVYTPTILIVVISWFSFYLGLDAVPGRISLLITCMLTLVTMHTGMRGILPPINYIQMMDVWMVCCMGFVFAALCEFIIVKFLQWKNHQKLKVLEENGKTMQKYMKIIETSNAEAGGNKMQENLKTRNPYVDFYKNMKATYDNEPILERTKESDFDYPISVMSQQNRPKPRQAWQGFEVNSQMSSPFEQYNEQYQEMLIQYRNNNNIKEADEWSALFKKKKKPIWVVIDRISQFAFPVMFLIFNATYWPYLLVGASNQ